jgi:transcriptional regulator with XRE-family HTH domain
MQIKEIIYSARISKGLNQKEFSRLIHKSQAMISKYESGAAIPPGNILKTCLDMVHKESGKEENLLEHTPEVDELIQLIRKQASDPKQVKLRQTIRLLLDIAAK